MKLAGWIGAVVLVIGGALGLKFAYDQGWLLGLPAGVRLALLYAVGVALLAAGEVVYRRVAPLAAVGLYGAGVASLFLVSYAGQVYFGLYDERVAFALMAGACGVGFAVALRGRLVSIAVLALIGANVAPFVLSQAPARATGLLAYVLALQCLAVGLAYVGREGRWWTLRSLALATCSFWVLGQLTRDATAHAPVTIGFAVLYAAIFQVENALSALRPRPTGDARRHFSPATFSMAVTAALTGAVLLWTRPWQDVERSWLLAGMAGLAVVLGALGLALRPRQADARQLASGAFIQAGTLLFIALPVSLAGPWLVLGWLGLALGYGVLGWWVRRPLTLAGGIAVWSFAAVYLIARTHAPFADPALRRTLVTLLDADLPVWFVLALVLQGVGHVLAVLATSGRFVAEPSIGEPRSGRALRVGGDVVAALATVLGAAAAVSALPTTGATLTLVVTAWALAAIARAAARPLYGTLAFLMAGAAAAWWIGADVLLERLGGHWSPGERAVLLNLTMASGAAALTTLVALARVTAVEGRVGGAQRRQLITGLSVLVLGALALGVEVDRLAARIGAAGTSAWPTAQLAALGQTLVALAATLLILPVARRSRAGDDDRRALRDLALGVGVLLALKFMLADTLRFAATEPRVAEAWPIANPPVLGGLLVVAALAGLMRQARGAAAAGLATLGVTLAAVPLVTGSVELDRLLGPDRTLVALSVYWGLYAIATIAVGFAARGRWLRLGGLALLAATLAKVVLVDLANAGAGWRILSFLGVGAILLATSVLYGKLSPSRGDDAAVEPGRDHAA